MSNTIAQSLLKYDDLLHYKAEPSDAALVQAIGQQIKMFRIINHYSVSILAGYLRTDAMLITIIEAGLGDFQSAAQLLHRCLLHSDAVATSITLQEWRRQSTGLLPCE